jgi:hypothetical protein
MLPIDVDRMRAALQAAAPGAPLSVTTHGAPRCAPSLSPKGAGRICFRSWSGTYVSVSPARPLTEQEGDALSSAIDPWDTGHGRSYVKGEGDAWPFAG